MNTMRYLARGAAIAATAAFAATTIPTPAGAQEPGPVNAGNTYKWGPFAKHWEFEHGLGSRWQVTGTGHIEDRYGMASLNSAARGSTAATLQARPHRYGRWEVRIRTRAWDTAYRNYFVRTELVPSGDGHCGAKNIALGAYPNLSRKIGFYIHNGRHAFSASKRAPIRNTHYHTLAVEVTPRHIAWFVDAKVVRNEHRPAALSGVPLTVRFSLDAPTPHTRMNRTMLQYDWLRYWTLKRPDAKSIKAPAAHPGTYRRAC